MKTTTYQVERAPVGSDSWEQIAPVVDNLSDATALLNGYRIIARNAKPKAQFRIIRTIRSVMTTK